MRNQAELTAETARTIAELVEESKVDVLIIRKRIGGKSKGKTFADYSFYEQPTIDSPDYVRVKLVETLLDYANQLEQGNSVELNVNKEGTSQFISYVTSKANIFSIRDTAGDIIDGF
jgi:hypothetical protein